MRRILATIFSVCSKPGFICKRGWSFLPGKLMPYACLPLRLSRLETQGPKLKLPRFRVQGLGSIANIQGKGGSSSFNSPPPSPVLQTRPLNRWFWEVSGFQSLVDFADHKLRGYWVEVRPSDLKGQEIRHCCSLPEILHLHRKSDCKRLNSKW